MEDDSTDMNPSLFVYIPTYNRPFNLRQQLDALTAQTGDWPGPVRVLVNDNASPGFSDADAVALASEYHIEVRRNPGNIHGNANISLGFVFARADEYLWILSDSDTLRSGALRAVASEGLVGEPDAITFDLGAQQPSVLVRTWQEGWSVIGEMGLISNVIYRTAVFAEQSFQAFYYHNSSFPHLAVILGTLKERGSLRIRMLPSSHVFAPPTAPHGETPNNNSLSLSGMPQLVWLLPPADRRRFCRGWLHAQGLGFVRYRTVHPGVHLASRALLVKHLGLEARITLPVLALLERVRPFVPKAAKLWVRRLG